MSFAREPALHLGRGADRARDGAGIRRRARPEQRLVQMEVRLHQPGNDELAGGVDLLGARAGHRRSDRGDPTAADPDVHQAHGIRRSRAANHEIHRQRLVAEPR